jgi:hypothetical protein
MLKNINLLLLAILFIIIIIFVYKLRLNTSIEDTSTSTSTMYNSFMNTEKANNIGNIVKYINISSNNLNKTSCENLPNNIDYDRLPELYCKKNDYARRKMFGDVIGTYILNENSEIGKNLIADQDILTTINNDPSTYINQPYVVDYISYMKNNPPQISTNTSELFGDIPTVAKQESFANPKLLFPSAPGDFYGSYKVDIGQFTLLDGITLHLEYSRLYLIDTDGSQLVALQSSKYNNVPFNRLPTTTIKLDFLRAGNIAVQLSSLLTTTDINIKQRKINLINDLGINGNTIYLFGNNGVYRLYNNLKILIFKLTRVN